METKFIYSIDILTAIRSVSEEWKAVPASCITNCFLMFWTYWWKYTETWKVHAEANRTRTKLQQYLFSSRRDWFIASLGWRSQHVRGHYFARSSTFVAVSEGSADTVNGCDDQKSHYSVSEESKALPIPSAALVSLAPMRPDAKSAIKACQRELRLLKWNALRQMIILDHSKPQ